MTSETRAPVLSTAAALLLGGVALAIALATGSGAILLDGAFNLCFFVTALVTLHIARLLKRPDDRQYPFGYLHFEPLINMVKGLLILGVGLIALIDAAFSLYRGGHEVAVDLALAYAAFAAVFCGVVLLALRHVQRQATSPLVQGDIENWFVNLAISVGMLVAFCLALVLQRAAMEAASKLVDPILVGLVVLLTLSVPIRMAGHGLMALLQRAPTREVVASIDEQVRGALATLPIHTLYVRVVQPGRTTYALVHVLLRDADAGLDVRRADALRRAVVTAVAQRHAPVIVDIVFTAIEEFAAPTTGFVVDPLVDQACASSGS
jgi:predicted Co/Zn/Cd cation transporter (cation efflux family)